MEEDVRQQFDEIKAILQQVAKSQAAAEARMDRADARMDRADARMNRAEAHMNRAEARMDRAEARMNRAEARMDRLEARMARNDERFEKRMRGFEKLVRIGMAELTRLERAQQRTEASLKALLDSLRKSGNGHHGSRPR